MNIKILFLGHNFTRILNGLGVTIKITSWSLGLGIILGVILGIIWNSNYEITNWLLKFYLTIFRIIPMVVLLFLFYYLLPQQFNWQLPANKVAILVFTLWINAELSDIVRSALQSINQHQREVGQSLGFNTYQIYRYILLPQAWPIILPNLINLITRVVKTTSLLMIINVMDVINVSQQIIEANNATYPNAVFTIYSLLALLYFAVNYPLSLLARYLRKDH